MARLSRAETQQRNRARVLAAAREEFSEHGFRDAKIDRIADRAELTRGAVYSNFPGKRALYFTVLAEQAEGAPMLPHPERGRTAREALGTFARTWVARLPLATDERHGAWIDTDLLPEIIADARVRRPFAQLMRLDSILLGLALERLRPPDAPGGRLVRVAEAALTILHGASQLAAGAPGFVEPFNVVRACEELADLDLDDRWTLPSIGPEPVFTDEVWSPPAAVDRIRGESARLTGNGVVAVLGLHRLSAAEDAVRAVPPEVDVTAVLVTRTPDELAPLVRLAIADLRGCLWPAVPQSALPNLQVVCDESGAVAAAAGAFAVDDSTETAVRIEAGRIVARADGLGACHVAAHGWAASGPAGACQGLGAG